MSEERTSTGISQIAVIAVVVVLCIVGSLAIWYFFFRQNKPAEPLPTLVPTAVVPEIMATSTAAGSSMAWDRIQASGKIVAGTTADYRPFEYYSDAFVLDGLDIALMTELVQRLGLQVEFVDMAFDGLAGALELDQIDLAIAALTVTDEREALVDFTNVYFISEDAVLAREDDPIASISRAQDLVGKRVGVQRGSIYESWVDTNLVEPGLISADSLLAYEKPEHALRDLRQNRNDVVLLDLAVANLAVADGGAKIVGQGFGSQRFAIAVKQGNSDLQARLNVELAALQNEGRLAELVSDYIQIPPEEVIPPPTPEPGVPTPTPAPPPAGCIDGMAFVADLNLPDDHMTNPQSVEGGTPFQKGWRIRNTGTCTWNTNYRLAYVNGNAPAARMGGQPTAVQAIVEPGQDYDIYVDLVAPIQPGVYQGFWLMFNDKNVGFGARIWVGISVPGPATPTPQPTQTPAADVNFTVDRTNINAGECVTFAWNVQNVTAVYFYNQNDNWWQHGVPGQGSSVECPPFTTRYELRVEKPNGAVDIREITIFVQSQPQAPVIRRFSANPQQIAAGQCVEVVWEIAGNANTIRILRNDSIILDNAPFSGLYIDCPPGAGVAQYKMEAVGPGGTSRATQNVTVIQPATPVPTPTPTVSPATATPVPTQPPPPVISNFRVTPNQIEVDACVNVEWNVSGNASLIQIKKDGAVILDNASYFGSGLDCSNDTPGTFIYSVEASNASGASDSRQQSVTVTEREVPTPTPSPLVGSWATIQYKDNTGTLQPVIPGSILALNFRQGGDLTGKTGCNSISGTYTANEGNLTLEVATVTQVACGDEALAQQERDFLSALSDTVTFQIEGDQLSLLNQSREPVMILGKLVAVPTN